MQTTETNILDHTRTSGWPNAYLLGARGVGRRALHQDFSERNAEFVVWWRIWEEDFGITVDIWTVHFEGIDAFRLCSTSQPADLTDAAHAASKTPKAPAVTKIYGCYSTSPHPSPFGPFGAPRV